VESRQKGLVVVVIENIASLAWSYKKTLKFWTKR
jgi:hypothetical protein